MNDQNNPHFQELLELARRDEKTSRLLQHAILGSMIHGIGHELLNCLKGIEGYIKLALKSTLLPPKTKLFLERSLECCAAGQRFNSVSQDLSWDTAVPDHPTALDQILLDVTQFCDSSFGPYCTVQLIPPDSLPETSIPGNSLRHILFNLCAAARECIKGQGQIILSMRENGLAGHLEIPRLTLEIQAHSARAWTTGGHPFPLTGKPDSESQNPASQIISICLLLAEIEAARRGLKLTSAKLKSEAFSASLAIPILPGAQPSLELSMSRNKPAKCNPLNLILLEDQELIADFLKTILENKGHRIKVFGHGGELADALGVTLDPAAIDVYLLDVCVPGRSGLEVGLKARDIDPESRIVFYSAIHNESDIKELVILDEKTKFIKKPFKINELLEIVEQVMQARIS